jgi:Bacteriophage CI repressor helix-turn-helix domain
MPLCDFDGITNNIKKIAGVKSQRDLAQVLGISPQAVTEAKNRGVVPGRWLDVIVKKFRVNKSELFETPEENLVRTYGKNPVTASIGVGWRNYPPQPGREVVGATDITLEEKPGTTAPDDFDMPEMVKMTMIVLASDTVYKPVLASNIRAFHKAVTMVGEMNELKEDIREIKQQNADLREDIKNLTEALQAAGIVPQKRDQKAG